MKMATTLLDLRIQWIEYEFEKILFLDFRALADDEFILLLRKSKELIKQNKNLRILFDVTDAKIYGNALQQAKLYAKEIQPYRKKSALIGVTGPKKILLNGILRFSGAGTAVKAFDNKESALKWMCS